MYQATTTLMYAPPANIANPSISTSTTDLNTLTLQLQSIGNTLGSPDVTSAVQRAIGTQVGNVNYSVTASVVTPKSASSSGSAIADSVNVVVLATSPQAASTLANAYANAVIAARKNSQQASLLAAENVLTQQLDLYKTAQAQSSPDYAALSLQLRDLQIAAATANGDFVISSPATTPSSPASPKPVKTAILGFVAGLFFGVVVAFVVGQFDTRIRDHRQAAAILGLTVIGRIPRLPRQASGERGLVAASQPEGSFGESLRVLRRNLEWSRIDGSLKSLIFTSCVKAEGKTLSLCNLAVTLARSGSKVVIVDADLRNPQVHEVFNLRNLTGLTSVALGRTTLEQALNVFHSAEYSHGLVTAVGVRGEHTSSGVISPKAHASAHSDAAPEEGTLRILTSGPLPPNPGEVIASHSVADVLASLAATDAEYVLIDTPPLLGFGDAGTLAALVDGVIMTVNVGKVRRPILEEGREVLESLPCRKIGLVVVGERLDDTKYAGYYASNK
jgi:non-specific protein-tyrosine kinase